MIMHDEYSMKFVTNLEVSKILKKDYLRNHVIS